MVPNTHPPKLKPLQVPEQGILVQQDTNKEQNTFQWQTAKIQLLLRKFYALNIIPIALYDLLVMFLRCHH